MKYYALLIAAAGTLFVLILGLGILRSKAIAGDAVAQDGDPTCSDGWRITGYFTPIETDYSSAPTREIEIKNVGTMSFNSDFLRSVFDEEKGYGEGWGKTRFGWYLGSYNGAWHKADNPLDANNSPLRPNSVAVDNSIIPNDSAVRIPGLPGQYGKMEFISNDVGVTVHGKHIDIYTGEGKAAEREMFDVTFEENGELQRVCFAPPAD
jgi:3D (Asp-Asp-Asp) domain-containing protein